MEGVMWKWTNYLSGWQARWFVLDNGVLSYYKSQGDVNNGCKGSLKMSACDIVVHPHDLTRLDLIIPGEQHYYVKAASAQERQQWLVALGTAKASLTYGKPADQSGKISPDIVRTKKSELRLYCDLLMQQVHSVKMCIQEQDVPNTEKLDEATSLLGATCDTFILTLEDCMKTANATIAYESPHQHVTDAALPSGPAKSTKWVEVSSVHRTTRKSRHSEGSRHPARTRNRTQSDNSSSDHSINESPVAENVHSDPQTIDRVSSNGSHHSDEKDVFVDAIDTKIPTFFSLMDPSFMDIQLDTDGGIPSLNFLKACRSIVPIFDKLNSTAFAPVKMDIQGNIRKIQQKHDVHPEKYRTLQKMVLCEMEDGQHHLSSSATVALLWLKRSLEFLHDFFKKICLGETDLSLAAGNAYNSALKPYHSWVVRGVFAVAVKALPTRETFLSLLVSSDEAVVDIPLFQSLRTDMENQTEVLSVFLQILNDFYQRHSIDSDAQV
ncbi:hypothetical protein ScPMuIL_016823 [Solemya velum]